MEQRLLTNHAWDNVNLRELATRAKEVCDGEIFNTLSFTYSDIDAYLNPDPAFDSVSIDGLVLVSIAVVIWCCSMTTELRRICELGLAVVSLRPKREGEHFAFRDDEGKVVCARATHLYKAFVVVIVLLPRLAIGVTLLIYGCVYLSNTPAVSDIILNTCALEIVKSIDEYLFDALMSHRMRLIMENTRYVYRSADKDSFRGHVTEAVPMTIRVMLIATVYAITFCIPLSNFHDDIAAFNSWVCEYDLSFAWVDHPILGLPVFTSVSAVDSEQPNDAEILKCWYQTHSLMLETRVGYSEHLLSYASEISNDTLKSYIRGTHSACASTTVTGNDNKDCPNLGVAQMITLAEMSSSDALDNPNYCTDFDAQLLVLQGVCMEDEYGKNVFTRKIEGTIRSSCEDMAELCTCDRLKADDEVCTQESYADIIAKQGITYAWIEKVLKICPQTCNQCSYVTGRRLDDKGASVVAGEPAALKAEQANDANNNNPPSYDLGDDHDHNDNDGDDGEMGLAASHPLVLKTRELESELQAARQRTAELEANFEARLAALEKLARQQQ